MKYVSAAAAAVVMLAVSTPAWADYWDAYTYYVIGERDDFTQNVYLQKSDMWRTDSDTGWRTAVIIQTDAGPSVENGVFAIWSTWKFDCTKTTFGGYNYMNFDGRGNQFGGGVFLEPSQVKMGPINPASYTMLAYKIVCGEMDPRGLEAVDNAKVSTLIDKTYANYDKHVAETAPKP